MPSKIWVVGEEVLAQDFNDYLQEQVVATFSSAAARATAIPAPNVGQFTYLADTGALEQWTDKTSPASWRKPWAQPWGLLAGPSVFTATTMPQNAWTIVTGSPVTLTGIPIGRRVLYQATAVCISAGADCILALQRTAGVAEQFSAWTFGGFNVNQRVVISLNIIFTTTEANQSPRLLCEKTTAGTGAAYVESGNAVVHDLGI